MRKMAPPPHTDFPTLLAGTVAQTSVNPEHPEVACRQDVATQFKIHNSKFIIRRSYTSTHDPHTYRRVFASVHADPHRALSRRHPPGAGRQARTVAVSRSVLTGLLWDAGAGGGPLVAESPPRSGPVGAPVLAANASLPQRWSSSLFSSFSSRWPLRAPPAWHRPRSRFEACSGSPATR